tara:strand:- start:2970 stop:4025 length:1056 start_codon:yes stop_codon:yes gene_type:complete
MTWNEPTAQMSQQSFNQAVRDIQKPPPRSPAEVTGPRSQEALAKANVAFALKQFQVSGRLGNEKVAKALQEEAKARIELAKGWLQPTDIDKMLSGLNIPEAEKAQIRRNAIDDKRPNNVREYDFSAQQQRAMGRDPKDFESWDINRRRAQSQNEFGPLEAGSRLIREPDGSARVEYLPGTKGYREQQDAAQKAQLREISKKAQSNIVVQDIDAAISMIEGSNFPVAGVGSLLSSIPGTPQYNLGQKLQTIKANIGFDELQKMRESSPTGGALGSIAVQELTALQSVKGSLDQAQDRKQIVDNLRRIREHTLRYVYGPEMGAELIKQYESKPNSSDGWQTLPNGVRIRRKAQ